MKVAIVLNCGKRISRKINADKIICCDGGFDICDQKPDLIIGDMDSIKSQTTDIPTITHSPHKNASDGELAVFYAKEDLHADEIAFYGVLGGRYDHVLCNLAIMRLANTLGMSAKAEEDNLDIYYIKGAFDLDTLQGETISILPFGENAVVTNSQNLEYPLDNLTLTPQDSRGLSNVSLGGKIHVDVIDGGALLFHYFKKKLTFFGKSQ